MAQALEINSDIVGTNDGEPSVTRPRCTTVGFHTYLLDYNGCVERNPNN